MTESSLSNVLVSFVKLYYQNLYKYNEANFTGYNKVINEEVTNLFTSVLFPVYIIIWLLFLMMMLSLKFSKNISWTVFAIVILISLVIIYDISLIGSYLINKNMNKITHTFYKQLIQPYTTVEFENFVEMCKSNIFTAISDSTVVPTVTCTFPST